MLTIRDNESTAPSAVQFSSATVAAPENGGRATIFVQRTGGTAGTVTVNYAVTGGTATSGLDYTAFPATLTFGLGELGKSFDITLLDDNQVESPETVQLALTNVTGATLGSPSTAVLTINDNELQTPSQLEFDLAGYSVTEGGQAVITVRRLTGSDDAVTVDYAAGPGGTAYPGIDYTPVSGRLSFPSGVTSATFIVPTLNDNQVESPETVNLVLRNPGGGAVLGTRSTAVLTVVDDDSPPPGVFRFSAANYTFQEGNGGRLTVTVERTVGTVGRVKVDYATSNGTAFAGSDYDVTSGTLTFSSGETTETFTIRIRNDNQVEAPETFNLTLSNPTDFATLGSPSTAVVTIVDDAIVFQGAAQAPLGEVARLSAEGESRSLALVPRAANRTAAAAAPSSGAERRDVDAPRREKNDPALAAFVGGTPDESDLLPHHLAEVFSLGVSLEELLGSPDGLQDFRRGP